MSSVFNTLRSYLGTNYVNDFNFLGRTYQVNLQGLGVTFFGIFFTPVFFSVIMKIFGRMPKKKKQGSIQHRARRENLVH